MKERYLVIVERPQGVSVARMREHIRDAVTSWGGQYEPPNADNNFTGDPLFEKLRVLVKRIVA